MYKATDVADYLARPIELEVHFLEANGPGKAFFVNKYEKGAVPGWLKDDDEKRRLWWGQFKNDHDDDIDALLEEV